jgi:hypothetical protein
MGELTAMKTGAGRAVPADSSSAWTAVPSKHPQDDW